MSMSRRKRAQERAKAEYEANHGRPKEPEQQPEPPSRLHTIIPIVLVVLGLGGVALWVFVLEPKLDQHQLTTQHGTAKGSVIADGTVIVFDAVDIRKETTDSTGVDRTETIARTRVTIVALATGKQIAQQLVEDLDGCRPASPGRLWCDLDGRLTLHDASTFVVLRSAEDTIAKAGLGRPMPKSWSIDGPRAHQMLDDGRVATLDAATLALTRSDVVPESLRRDLVGNSKQGSIDMGSSCDAWSLNADRMMSRIKQPATWTLKSTGERAKLVKGSLSSSQTYLQPGILAGDPPIFVHRATLDGPIQLSRLRADGTNGWTVELLAKDCEQVALVGSTFVMTTTGAKRRAVALDADSGAVRWELGF